MAYYYSDPGRERVNPYALPDVEVWHGADIVVCSDCAPECTDHERATGWFYWFCFPGCLPDSELTGPFDTEAEAIADSQSRLTNE